MWFINIKTREPYQKQSICDGFRHAKNLYS